MTQHKDQLQEFRNILEHGGGLPGDDARRLCLELAKENERLRSLLDPAERLFVNREGVHIAAWGVDAFILVADIHQALATNQPTEGKQNE